MRIDGLLSPSGLCRALVLGLILLNVGCNGTSGWAMNRSGMKNYKRGNYAQARHQFSRAIANNPCNADYRYNLAMAVQKQGDAASAEKILRHNLTINAMHQPTYHSLAQVLTSQGRAAEAQDLIAGWAETQPYVPEANIELAWVQRETGNVAGAEQSLRNALKANPTHPTALAHLGQLYHESGRGDEATAYYQRSLAAKWDQPEVQSRLATLVEPGTSGRNGRRAAMMQNPYDAPMVAGGPIMTSSPTMASTGLFGSDSQAIVLEDPRSNPRPRVGRNGRVSEDGQVIAAYPLPNFDSPTTMAALPNGSIAGQPATAFQQPVVAADTMMAPQMVSSTNSPNPTIASGPPLLPQADPATWTATPAEMTASMPVVDPH